MVVEGEYRFPAAREVIWDMLLDPEVIARTIPGTRRMARVAHERYEGKMRVGFGPFVAAEFDLVVTLVDVLAPEHYTMLVDGHGRLGFTRGKALVALSPDGAGGGTVVRYAGDLQIGGALARLGHRLLDAVSARLVRQGLDALRREVAARLAARPQP